MLYFQLALGWILYFAIHSLLASNAVKKKCCSGFPALFAYYRIMYNLVALGGLVLMAACSFRDTTYLFEQTPGLKAAGVMFIVMGGLMLSIAFASFNVKEFLGLKFEAESPEGKLVTTGIYNYVRHPLYTGVLLLLPGLFLSRPTISICIFSIITIAYIEIGSRLEEKKLISHFGKDYVEYSRKVKRYFPFIY